MFEGLKFEFEAQKVHQVRTTEIRSKIKTDLNPVIHNFEKRPKIL